MAHGDFLASLLGHVRGACQMCRSMHHPHFGSGLLTWRRWRRCSRNDQTRRARSGACWPPPVRRPKRAAEPGADHHRPVTVPIGAVHRRSCCRAWCWRSASVCRRAYTATRTCQHPRRRRRKGLVIRCRRWRCPSSASPWWRVAIRDRGVHHRHRHTNVSAY